METGRNHKNDLIVALITAVTGLSVALIANWDKISTPDKPIVIVDSVKVEQEKPEEVSVEYDINNPAWLLEEAFPDAEKLVNDGWEIEHYHLEPYLEDSSKYFIVNLIKGYTYDFQIYGLEDDIEATISLHFSNEDLESHTFTIDTQAIYSLAMPSHVKSFFIWVEGEKWNMNYCGLLITSKKT